MKEIRNPERHFRRAKSKMENLRVSEIEQLQARLETEKSGIRRVKSAHPMASPHAPGKLNPREISKCNKPYFMENGNELRFFKSGYTGYLPRSRDYIAVGLTQMSNSGKFEREIFPKICQFGLIFTRRDVEIR